MDSKPPGESSPRTLASLGSKGRARESSEAMVRVEGFSLILGCRKIRFLYLQLHIRNQYYS